MPLEPTEWTIEAIDFLAQEYIEAEKMREKAYLLLNWIIADPLNLEEVIELWNECQKK